MKIKYCLEQRCINYELNPSKMINSILERHRKRIVIDRLFIENNQGQQILLNPDQIKDKVNEHFQYTAIPLTPYSNK